MDEKTSQIMGELKRNPALLRRVMESRDGQDLLRLLDGQGEGFHRAVRSAARGDTADMAERIRRMAQSPDGAAILERIRHAVES